MCKFILLGLFLSLVIFIVAALAYQPTPDPNIEMTRQAVVLTNTYVYEALISTQTAAAETAVRASPTAAQGFVAECQWNWNTQARPDLSEQIQAAYDAQGMAGVRASAEYFGEDCLDPTTRRLIRFGPMQTDYQIQLAVHDLNDPIALQNDLIEILTVLQPFLVSEGDGVPPGDITVTVRLPDDTPVLIMTFEAEVVTSAYARGDLATILNTRLETILAQMTPDINGTQTASAAQTATYAPRPDPLLLTATAIARP